MKSNFNQAANSAAPSNFGNNVRDNILQAQIDNELGAYITVDSSPEVSPDGTTVILQLWSKSGAPLGAPQPITVDAVGNKVVKSIEIKDVTVEGKIEKQLVLTFKGQTDPPAIYCSLNSIFNTIAEETARAKAAEGVVTKLVEDEELRALTAETDIERGYQEADQALSDQIALVEAAIPTKVSELENDAGYIKNTFIVKVNFALGDDGETLTANKTPGEVLDDMYNNHLVLGVISDAMGNELALGPCIAGLTINNKTCYTFPVFASGSSRFEIIGDDTWHFNN